MTNATRRPSALPAVTAPTYAPTTSGHVLRIRGADERDTREIQAMHARCGQETLANRYLTPRAPGRRLTRHLVNTDLALVGQTPTGSVVGLANLAASEEDRQIAEIAVVVEDEWQRRGLGTALLRQLVAGARLLGFYEVVSIAPSSGTWGERALAALGDTLLQRTPFGEAVVRLQLAPHHVGLLRRPVEQLGRAVVAQSGAVSDP